MQDRPEPLVPPPPFRYISPLELRTLPQRGMLIGLLDDAPLGPLWPLDGARAESVPVAAVPHDARQRIQLPRRHMNQPWLFALNTRPSPQGSPIRLKCS
jgi:hypothetical protein